MRSGGRSLVDALVRNGCERVFTVPGESCLAILDALHDAIGIDVVLTRQEGGAAMMAEATARVSGRSRPAAGVALVSRGPGLANAMAGLHVARQASTPLLLLVGLAPAAHDGREPFQDVAISPLAGTFAKHCEVVHDAARLPEAVSRALVIANAGRPGPVILGLPEDMLSTETAAVDVPAVLVPEPGPGYSDMIGLAEAIENAEWPVVVAGGPGWSAAASAKLQEFAERLDLPVVASFRSQDVIDNRSTVYCGHAGFAPAPKLTAALTAADLLIVVGPRLDEITTGGYATIASPVPKQRIVHVHPDGATIGINHAVSQAIVSSVERFTARLDDLCPSYRPGMPQRWSSLRRDLRAAFENWQRIPASPGSLRLEDVVAHLSATLPDDAIVTNGAGNYAAYLHRAFTYKRPGTQLAPLSGTMGYGLPAAIAAKLCHPGRRVVCLAGDGCFQMTAQELATAVQYGLAITVVVANNSMHGTIRAAQERRYPGRVVATSLVNPDFARLAASCGAAGERVSDLDTFARALARASAAQGPSLIELTLDRDAIAPGLRLNKMPNNSAK